MTEPCIKEPDRSIEIRGPVEALTGRLDSLRD